jgi:hypothetical protein
MGLGIGAGSWLCEATPLFSLRAVGPTGRRQGHIYIVSGKWPNIWCLGIEWQTPRSSVAYPPASPERERWRAGAPNIGSRRCPVEFFSRYGPSKKGVPSLQTPLGSNKSRILWTWIIFWEGVSKTRKMFIFNYSTYFNSNFQF